MNLSRFLFETSSWKYDNEFGTFCFEVVITIKNKKILGASKKQGRICIIKVQILWEGHKIWKNLLLFLKLLSTQHQNKVGDFSRFLWPSQDIWTLLLHNFLAPLLMPDAMPRLIWDCFSTFSHSYSILIIFGSCFCGLLRDALLVQLLIANMNLKRQI